jgi:hypothetical protein
VEFTRAALTKRSNPTLFSSALIKVNLRPELNTFESMGFFPPIASLPLQKAENYTCWSSIPRYTEQAF